MNIQLLSELAKTNLKPLYYFKLPPNTGDKALSVFMATDIIDWSIGGVSTGEIWQYDVVSWSNFSPKLKENEYFTTTTKYKSFMQRIKTWEEDLKRKQRSMKGKKISGAGWEF